MRSKNLLSEIRMSKKMSATELAMRADTTPSYISLIERWDYVPGPNLRRRIACALGVVESDIWPELCMEDACR